MNSINRLEDWYSSQCNGEWEHSFGIEISTLDNPGWRVKIDLAETSASNLAVERTRVYVNEDDWFDYAVLDQVFVGNGDSKKLETIVNMFLRLAKVV